MAEKILKFVLKTIIYWATGSCHDDTSRDFTEEIEARSREEAIEKARKIVQEKHEQNKHRTDYGHVASLNFEGSKVWGTRFVEEQPYVPPREAIPAVPAHFKEEIPIE